MPIRDETNSVTEGKTALELFVDRFDARRVLARYLHGEPQNQILFFHGDGGNGKSLLLEFLRTQYCKCFSTREWTEIKAADDEAFAQFFEHSAGAVAVPSTLLDFAPLPGGGESHQEALPGLLQLRRGLAGHGLHFPLFDFACLLYYQHTEGLNRDRLKALLPAEEADLAAAMIDLGLSLANKTAVGSIVKAVLFECNKHLGRRVQARWTIWLQKRGLDQDRVAAIMRLDPARELVGKLPELFAEDLNAAMRDEGAPPRVVLFFDTHEALWGDRPKRELAGDRFFQRDEWLRCLLTSLDLAYGIVVVVAGREPPRWAEANTAQIPEQYVERVPVEHLTDADALRYLASAKVGTVEMQECLREYARVGVNQIHPQYLGLCVDIVRAAQRDGKQPLPEDFQAEEHHEDKGRVLIDRLLRYVDAEVKQAVIALSACRAFSKETYRALGQNPSLEDATRPLFEVLTGFSFMWRARERGEQWFRAHALLRRLLAEREDAQEILHDAHVAFEDYYRQQAATGNQNAIAEAIYHANRLDWQRGVEEWVDVFEGALRLSQYGMCGLLLEVRQELHINHDFSRGNVSYSEGQYFARLARYGEARQEYEEAITAYDAALSRAPDDVYAHNNKGIVLESRSMLHLQSGDSHDGIADLWSAI